MRQTFSSDDKCVAAAADRLTLFDEPLRVFSWTRHVSVLLMNVTFRSVCSSVVGREFVMFFFQQIF